MEYNLVCAGRQWGPPDVAAGGRALAADGHSQPRDQMRLPQPARGLHEVCHAASVCLISSIL